MAQSFQYLFRFAGDCIFFQMTSLVFSSNMNVNSFDGKYLKILDLLKKLKTTKPFLHQSHSLRPQRVVFLKIMFKILSSWFLTQCIYNFLLVKNTKLLIRFIFPIDKTEANSFTICIEGSFPRNRNKIIFL